MPRTASARRSHAFAGSLTVEQAEAGDLFFRRTCRGTTGPCLRRDPKKMLNYTSEMVSTWAYNSTCQTGQKWA